MMKNAVAGLDIGTSSLKITLIDIDSSDLIENIKIDYPRSEIAPGVVPAQMYEEVIKKAIYEIEDKVNLKGIGLSFHMYSLCEQTDDGIVVYQWNSLWDKDSEAELILKELAQDSGCPIDTLYPAYKMASAKGRKFLPYGLKEHIVNMLTGELFTDYTCAAASGLFDIKEKRWNSLLIKHLGFDVADMPIVKRYNTKLETKSQRDGKAITLAPGLGDGASASYACLGVSPICANLGTSMAVRAVTSEIKEAYSEKPWIWSLDEERYIVGGISSNGCSVLNWAEDMGFSKEIDIHGGNSEVMFIPWLHGERTPYWSSNLRGTFVGMNINTNMQALNGAIVKGVAFTAVKLMDIIYKSINGSGNELVVAAGGGVHINSLMEIISGCSPFKIGILNNYDYLAAYGAALTAAEALGVNIEKKMEVKEIITPNHAYEDEYRRWTKVSEALLSLYN
ncbi:MAG: carbohydrate kinase [Clostridia bacterium]|jgi:gluconokinase|nr:carbohydrate kinase [Clostridia bacterium]